MLEGCITGKEQSVIEDDGAVPIIHIYEQNVFVGGFEYQRAIACIFRLDSRFTGHAASQSFAKQVSDSFDTRSCIDIADHPLPGV